MRLERQNSYPTAQIDVFNVIDWMFPRGLDHHAMFAGVPVAEQVMVRVARHLAGLGVLPEQAAPIGEIILGAPHAQSMDVTFHGRAAHAGMFPEEGRSAIQAAARACKFSVTRTSAP